MYVVVVVGTTTNTIKYQHTHWVERLFPEHFYGAKLMRPFFLCRTVVYWVLLVTFTYVGIWANSSGWHFIDVKELEHLD